MSEEEGEAPAAPSEESIPGTIPDAPAPNIPDWYRVGWRAVSGIDRPMVEGEERDRSIIAMFIDDMYYGQWYHNAAIIFFVRTLAFMFISRRGADTTLNSQLSLPIS